MLLRAGALPSPLALLIEPHPAPRPVPWSQDRRRASGAPALRGVLQPADSPSLEGRYRRYLRGALRWAPRTSSYRKSTTASLNASFGCATRQTPLPWTARALSCGSSTSTRLCATAWIPTSPVRTSPHLLMPLRCPCSATNAAASTLAFRPVGQTRRARYRKALRDNLVRSAGSQTLEEDLHRGALDSIRSDEWGWR